MSRLFLTGGTVVREPDASPQVLTVCIDGEKIADDIPSIAPNDRVIDCTGCTVVAGFWNSHVHFFERKWADASSVPSAELQAQLLDFTRYGFTTVFDLSSALTNTNLIRSRVTSGEVHGPRILTTGEGMVPPGFALPDLLYHLMGQMKVPLPQAADVETAAAAAKALIDAGVDAIKLFASAPTIPAMSADAMRAAVEEASKAGLPTFVHPNTADDIARAVEAGVTIVAHTTPASGEWSPLLVDAMRERAVALIPTLHLWEHFARHDRFSKQQQQTRMAVDQLRAWHAAGGDVLFGTDWGAVPPAPSREYELMENAGMSFHDILASLTTSPGGRFAASEQLGKVAGGYVADLVVLDGPPVVSTLGRVRHTIRNGKILYPGT